MFRQVSALEQGARMETRPRQRSPNYDERHHHEEGTRRQGYWRRHDQYMDERDDQIRHADAPPALDEFGKHFQYLH